MAAGRRTLELQAEAFGFHLVILGLVEAVADGDAVGGAGGTLARVLEDADVEHLIREVAAVEMHFQDALVEVLKLGHREDLRQELEADRLEMDLLLEAAERHAKDPVVVEGKGRDRRDGEPLGGCGIVAARDILLADEREERDGDDPLARVAVHFRETAELFNVGRLQPRLFRQLALGSRLGVFVYLQETARERPVALVWIDSSFHQQDGKTVFLVVTEDDAVSCHCWMGVFISVCHIRYNRNK